MVFSRQVNSGSQINSRSPRQICTSGPQGFHLRMMNEFLLDNDHIQRDVSIWINMQVSKLFYYMEESVLLGTKPLIDSIRHFIGDSSGIFFVCYLCECRIVQWCHHSRLLLLLNWFLTLRLLFRIKSLYKNITRWLEDMNFMFSWQEQYLTSELCSLVRYCSCHENIKFISSHHCVISSMYFFFFILLSV